MPARGVGDDGAVLQRHRGAMVGVLAREVEGVLVRRGASADRPVDRGVLHAGGGDVAREALPRRVHLLGVARGAAGDRDVARRSGQQVGAAQLDAPLVGPVGTPWASRGGPFRPPFRL